MKPVCVSLKIASSLEVVFQTISDVRNFREAVPQITNIEFLTECQFGEGTRFRETRLMNGREETVEIEVTEHVDNDRVRMISDAGGTVWDTLFTVAEQTASPHVSLDLRMDIKPYTLKAKIITPLIRRMVVKGVEADMEAVKTYCESR